MLRQPLTHAVGVSAARVLVVGIGVAVSAHALGDECTPLTAGLRSRLAETPADQTVAVVIELKSKADLSVLDGLSERDRRRALVPALRRHAETQQRDLRAHLAAQGAQDLKTLWMINALAAQVRPAVVWSLCARPEIGRIDLDRRTASPLRGGRTMRPSSPTRLVSAHSATRAAATVATPEARILC